MQTEPAIACQMAVLAENIFMTFNHTSATACIVLPYKYL